MEKERLIFRRRGKILLSDYFMQEVLSGYLERVSKK